MTSTARDRATAALRPHEGRATQRTGYGEHSTPMVTLTAERAAAVALAAALADTCHEAVPDALGDEGPCDRPMVGYRVDDEESTYPVCSQHMRAPMAPLKAAILGGIA